METINPSRIKSGISGAIFGGIICAIELRHQLISDDSTMAILGVIIASSIGALAAIIIALKYHRVVVGDKTASQVASAITFESTKARRGFLGLKAVDDMGGKIVCRSVFFSKEALDKIEEIITANQ
jgi:hypothetical protein